MRWPRSLWKRTISAGSEAAEVQGSIWLEWHRSDALGAAGRIDEAALIRAQADLAEEEFLWGPVANREDYLIRKTAGWREALQERE